MDFDNKVVLITGGGTGIGKAAAKGFLAGGATVVLNGRRQEILEKAAMELDPSSDRVAIVAGDIASVEAYIDIILKGTFNASAAAIPEMQKRGQGAIVNVGSMWASAAIGATPSSAYSAAKAGVHALTRNLAIEFAKENIRVNTVAPAVVETPVYETFMTTEEVRQVLPTFNSFHPLGRNGQPQDVVEAILFLASDKASWITGTILPVDGGVLAGRHLVEA